MPARRRIHPEPIEEPVINLTPLIDVVFVVLIMFILVAPMLEIDRIQLAMGAEHKGKDLPAPSDKGALSLHVFDDNSVSLNGKKVNMKELVALLKVAKRQNPKGIPQVFQDKKAFFGTYQAVKNAVEESGFEQMDVVLKPS
ncbi:MAG TPA: biopolymer transporter ExbD [Rhabdochlamydiaceae bacterium]